MGRIIFLLLVVVLGYWCFTSGVIYNLTHQFEPEPQRAAVLHGPRKDGVKFAPVKENMQYVIDSKIGTPGQRVEAMLRETAAMNQGLIGKFDENTPCKVIETSNITMYRTKYPIVKVAITGGEYKGSRAFVQREDVIDSPVMELFAAMRNAAKKQD